MGFCGQSVLRTITIKAPRLTSLDDLQPGLVVPEQNFLGDLPFWTSVHNCERIGAMPLDLNYGGLRISEDATN